MVTAKIVAIQTQKTFLVMFNPPFYMYSFSIHECLEIPMTLPTSFPLEWFEKLLLFRRFLVSRPHRYVKVFLPGLPLVSGDAIFHEHAVMGR
jgi:hypothetical protein